jgi:hypothetical protein
VRGIRAAAIAGLLAVLAGCGGDDEPRAAPSEPTTTTTTAVDAAGAGHHGTDANEASELERPTNVDFDGPERERLAAQLVEARAVALRYPTVADAVAAGYELTTPYAPGTGAHYGKDADTQPPGQPLDVSLPQSYLYDGTEPGSKLVGLMYVQLGGDEAPEGFAGPLDGWSPTRGQCLVPGTTDPVFPTKSSVTEEECNDADGTYLDVTAWIQHVWVVPGWEAPGGVFAPYNDDIVCADGSTETGPTDGCEPPALAAPAS